MAMVGPLIDDVLRRVRDPQASATSRATVRDLFDRAQVLFVRWTGTLIRERSFVLTPERLLYDLDPADTLRILEVTRDSDAKRLYPVRWNQLFHQQGSLWWRTFTAGGPVVWAHVGTRHFAVFPAPTVALGNVTVTIRDQRRPTALTADSVDLDLDSDFHPALLDFVEALLLLRMREPALVQALPQTEAFVA